MTIKQLSVFIENRRGKLAEITEILASNEIDLRAVSLVDSSEFGQMRMIASNPDVAFKVLRDAGMMVRFSDVVAVAVTDKAGEFSKAAKLIADVGVNLEYMYALASRKNDEAVLIMKLDQAGEGIEALRKGGFRIITPEEIYE